MARTITETTFDTEVLGSEQPSSSTSGPSGADPATRSRRCSTRSRRARVRLTVAKVNIDEQPELAQRYGVMSIPTMILFKDGEPAAAAIGAQPKGMLEKNLGLVEA